MTKDELIKEIDKVVYKIKIDTLYNWLRNNTDTLDDVHEMDDDIDGVLSNYSLRSIILDFDWSAVDWYASYFTFNENHHEIKTYGCMDDVIDDLDIYISDYIFEVAERCDFKYDWKKDFGGEYGKELNELFTIYSKGNFDKAFNKIKAIAEKVGINIENGELANAGLYIPLPLGLTGYIHIDDDGKVSVTASGKVEVDINSNIVSSMYKTNEISIALLKLVTFFTIVGEAEIDATNKDDNN